MVAQAIVIEYLVPLVNPFFIQETKEECAIELSTSASEFNLLTKLLQDDRGKDFLVHYLSLLPPDGSESLPPGQQAVKPRLS